MRPNKAETAVHCCLCLGDMAVRMRKLLARPWVGVRSVTCFYCCFDFVWSRQRGVAGNKVISWSTDYPLNACRWWWPQMKLKSKFIVSNSAWSYLNNLHQLRNKKTFYWWNISSFTSGCHWFKFKFNFKCNNALSWQCIYNRTKITKLIKK